MWRRRRLLRRCVFEGCSPRLYAQPACRRHAPCSVRTWMLGVAGWMHGVTGWMHRVAGWMHGVAGWTRRVAGVTPTCAARLGLGLGLGLGLPVACASRNTQDRTVLPS